MNTLIRRLTSCALGLLVLCSTVLAPLDASAATITKKTGILNAGQPQMTFYDIDSKEIGTFSHAGGSDLIGFNASQVIYRDSNGVTQQQTYGRSDVTLYLEDRLVKFDSLTQTRRDSYYVSYTMGSAKGGVFSNNIQVSESDDGYVLLSVHLNNVVFRDSNQMDWQVSYRSTRKSATSGKTLVTTNTVKGQTSFSKCKLDSAIGTDNKKPSTDNNNNSGTVVQPDGSTNKIPNGYYDENGNLVGGGSGTTEGGDNNSGSGGSNNGGTGGDNGGNTQPTPTVDLQTPYIILENYSAGSGSVEAGSSFPLSFTCRNTSAQVDLENIIVTVTPSEGLRISGGTNSYYVPVLSKNDRFEKTIQIDALTSAKAEAHKITLAFSYEYVNNGTRQRGEISQDVSVNVVQEDRFSIDPISGLMESSVGEEIYIVSKYVNKSRGDIYNVSATITGNFPGSGQIQHVGNVAAGVSGEVEFNITPDTAGPLSGTITYTYEDAMGNTKELTCPVQTTILEAPSMDAGMMFPGDMGMEEEPEVEPTSGGFLQQLTNPGSWQMWTVLGVAVVVAIVVVKKVQQKRRDAALLEEDDEDEDN